MGNIVIYPLELQFGSIILELRLIPIQLVVQVDALILKTLQKQTQKLLRKLIPIQLVVQLAVVNHKIVNVERKLEQEQVLDQEQEQGLETEQELDQELELELALEPGQGRLNSTVDQVQLVQA